MGILIKGGHVIDPANKIDAILDILVESNKISKVAKNIQANPETIIDARDKIVAPGLVDMHVHLRQPGREDKETVATATAAAAKGGVTTVLAMPNTQPAMDCVESVELLQGIIDKSALVNVYICGTITKGRLGQDLSNIAVLKKSGVIAISDDGSSVDSDELMYEALRQAKRFGLLTICHSEDKELSKKGVVNLGFNSTRLGLRGISNESEYKRVRRDTDLAKKTGALIHIAHVSCRESVEIIAQAKKKGVEVTSETAPHYFALTEEALLGYDTNMKMNPPLRSKNDLLAIRQGLKDGIIDAIASDHAPHTENEKDIEFERAEFGVVGLETELSVGITELLDKNILNWPELIEKFCLNPAKILGIEAGRLTKSAPADIIIISDQQSWVVSKQNLISKSKNCAFLGQSLKGMVDYTICNGKVVYKRQAKP
ncbi:MAG: dihydroorotase [Candidatus Omnitrophota bacterium]|nr:dihydroorotase [Candidatus Omnitrophota bacterium]